MRAFMSLDKNLFFFEEQKNLKKKTLNATERLIMKYNVFKGNKARI